MRGWPPQQRSLLLLGHVKLPQQRLWGSAKEPFTAGKGVSVSERRRCFDSDQWEKKKNKALVKKQQIKSRGQVSRQRSRLESSCWWNLVV